VTIAAGFTCQDGIVLCADTQESWGDDKTHVYKLSPFDGPNWSGGIAGSGTGYLIDYASTKILESITKIAPGTSPAQISESLASVMEGLYKKEFGMYPAAAEDKQIQILVGLCDKSKSKTYLFSIDSTLVLLVPKERVIGAGELLKHLASDFQKMTLTLSQGMYVAMYLVWDAKRRYTTVGGDTLVLGIHSSGAIRAESIWSIALQERLLKRIDFFRNHLLISLDKETPNHEVKAWIRHIERGIRWTRKEILDLDTQREKQRKAAEKAGAEFAKDIRKGGA
jgi:hypothetical protein